MNVKRQGRYSQRLRSWRLLLRIATYSNTTLTGGFVSWFLLKACPKCQGDLVSDDGDWLCLHCGTYYYMGLYRNSGTCPAYGTDKANRTAWRSEAADQSSAREDFQAEQVRPSPQDEFPQGPEKSLVWSLSASQGVAVTAPEPSMAIANIITDSMMRPINLETFQR